MTKERVAADRRSSSATQETCWPRYGPITWHIHSCSLLSCTQRPIRTGTDEQSLILVFLSPELSGEFARAADEHGLVALEFDFRSSHHNWLWFWNGIIGSSHNFTVGSSPAVMRSHVTGEGGSVDFHRQVFWALHPFILQITAWLALCRELTLWTYGQSITGLTHTFTLTDYLVSSIRLSCMSLDFGRKRSTGGNPHQHGENMQTSDRKTFWLRWDSNCGEQWSAINWGANSHGIISYSQDTLITLRCLQKHLYIYSAG